MQYHLELETIQNEFGRKYVVNNRHYDSVTTVTGYLAKQDIEKWKQRIGYAEANRICEESSIRGTQLHSLCENYFKCNLTVEETNKFREDSVDMFVRLKPELVYLEPWAIETCLYSDLIMKAGRTDFIGMYKGIPAVVDFKSSRKPKKRDWIDGYFAQLTIYALMFKERTGITLEYLVILMVSLNGQVQIFEEQITQWHFDNMYKYLDYYKKHVGKQYGA